MDRMADGGSERTLLDFLQQNRDRVLDKWASAVRTLPAAHALDEVGLRDHLPALYDRLIESVAQRRNLTPLVQLPEVHARTRVDQGFSLGEIAQEYKMLRGILFRMMDRQRTQGDWGALFVLNESIDDTVILALGKYHDIRSRTLVALDRISNEALAPGAEDVRGFLQKFLQLVLDMTGAADAAVVFLREWDRLVVAAAAGVEHACQADFSQRVGEGLVGRVAADREPRYTTCAASDPLVGNPAVAAAGIQALYAVPLLHGDEVIGVAQVGSTRAARFSDDDRRLFLDVAQRAALLIAQRRLAEERDVFLGVLGHDLRSPLNTILMGAQFIERGEPLSPGAQRTVERVVGAGRRIERMIGDLADYSKARFGSGIEVERRPMDLAECVDQLFADLRTLHVGRELRVERAGHLGGEWDRDRIVQALTNLVNNAVAHGATDRPIVLSLDGAAADEVVVRVHNEGAPISPEIMPRLFEAFRRGETHAPGMGLGLFIVRHIARAHRGNVEVESSPEDGTTFVLRLPRVA